ncbi:MAG: magnesium chelatase, partial [Ilumatobacteraceae bacterium]
IRTHYPLDAVTEVQIIRQEARPPSVGDVTVSVPGYMELIVATFSQLARSSSQVNQRSGVSVRLSVSNYEVMCANALRRGLRLGETAVVPRICDLEAFASSTGGKIEIEALEEGREGHVLRELVKGAVLTVFRDVVSPELTREVLTAFEEGTVVHTGEDVPSIEQAQLIDAIPALKPIVDTLVAGDDSVASVAAAIEFVLEGMHLSKRLNKDASASGGGTYRSR